MPQNGTTLWVSEAAKLCGVNRNTVGLWIRSKKLRAYRIGNKYAIPVEELVFFLRSTGQRIPGTLSEALSEALLFRSFLRCWEYFREKMPEKRCEGCTVYENRLAVCFTGKDTATLQCGGLCHQCNFYLDVYAPRMAFLSQLDFPAAISKDLHLWAGNDRWAGLCGLREADLIGMGIEDLYHPDSLGVVIGNHKRRTLGDPRAPRIDRIFIQSAAKGKIAVDIGVYPLREPSGTWLLLAEGRDG